MSIILKVDTALKIGLRNIGNVLIYRLGLKTKINRVTRLKEQLPTGGFYSDNSIVSEDIQRYDLNDFKAFGYIPYSYNNGIPNWFYSPLSKREFSYQDLAWYNISDFNNEIGDIKGVWEASRFEWIIKFVEQEKSNANSNSLIILDNWLSDWCRRNPSYLGPNWKCGQEASIRVITIIAGLISLEQVDSINPNLIKLIEIHLRRIAPTISYAIAQNNNHGTSEAAALYMGGAILNRNNTKSEYLNWQKTGEKWLNERAHKLIFPDGGFSQYSSNYHRLVLDTYSLAELLRSKLNLKPFSKQLYKRLAKATQWLYIMTQDNGDTPNLGSNDGAWLLQVGSESYRDFRPTVQLSSTLFCGYSYYIKAGPYDEILSFFNLRKISRPNSVSISKNQFFKHFGLMTKATDNFFIAFKFPRYKFRPSQCDALHLDVWLHNENILRDGGSYSYNTDETTVNYFRGPKSHNTAEFDSHLQMPRLGRFIFASWLKPKKIKYSDNLFSCTYLDYWGCQHTRTVTFGKKSIQVIDSLSGFKHQAIIRWRLNSDAWILKNNILSNGKVQIEIRSENDFKTELVKGYESRYYYKKNVIPVLEITVTKNSEITSTIKEII